MNPALKTPPAVGPAKPPSTSSPPASFRRGLKRLLLLGIILTLCFARPLFDLIRYAAKSELYSYILLVPFVVAYLIRTRLPRLDLTGPSAARWALFPFLAGALILAGYVFALKQGWSPAPTDYLASMTLSFLFCLLGLGFIFIPEKCLRALAFPIAFAFFCVPLPELLQGGIEAFLQHGSATVASAMLSLSGMPVFQHEMTLQLPGFQLQVAPECSGIHSSLVLAITSLLAAYLFLQSNWRRSVLVLAVIPLALLRNGFRIFTIAQLCVRIGPEMIDSPIHRRGGPIFFALSLIPLLLLLVFLRKGERQNARSQPISNE